ncbi:MAG: hypothetical protein OXC62_00275 [Aestuariivita sp.]|nr:hypothetical protein [Aestuariivita sp.]
MLKSNEVCAHLLIALITVSVLTGCSWFRNDEETISAEIENINPLLPDSSLRIINKPQDVYQGTPIEQVTDFEIKPTRTGAILLAKGVGTRQGAYDIQLTPLNNEEIPVNGVLEYRFEAIYPSNETPIGNITSRRLVAARSISTELIKQVDVFRVVSKQNAIEKRHP